MRAVAPSEPMVKMAVRRYCVLREPVAASRGTARSMIQESNPLCPSCPFMSKRSHSPEVHPPANVVWHAGLDAAHRLSLTKQQGLTLWFTGLSASGKSTLACALELHLLEHGHQAFRLDGDNLRFGLNKDLAFSESDRKENIRRVGEVAMLFASSGTITLSAFISPYLADREIARAIHEKAKLPFIEVFVDASLAEVEKRDPKGLYKKARQGIIKGSSSLSPPPPPYSRQTDFTGISAPYEEPPKPEIHIKTDNLEIQESVDILVKYLMEHKYI